MGDYKDSRVRSQDRGQECPALGVCTGCPLPPGVKKLCLSIGFENLIALLEAAGGQNVYIPKKDCVLNCFLIEKIQKEYNGKDVRKLAEKYGLSERTIYRYVQGRPKKS
ncbi:MAG: hypothetical protein LUH07_08960 [Lachnospiraceae bacterium]|nr:hypothetical protein [Lachnospiraceae bacterium]